MIQILHYYCKPRRENLLNNITYQQGISCQVQSSYLDISDIVKELTNKNHIDCIAIDEDLFGAFDEAVDIISKIEVLKYVCENTEILIIAPERTKDDEIIMALRESGLADCIITKEMFENFEDIVIKYFNGEAHQETQPEIKEDISAFVSDNTEHDNIQEEQRPKFTSKQEVEEDIVEEEKQEDSEETETPDKSEKQHTLSTVPDFVMNMLNRKEKNSMSESKRNELPELASRDVLHIPEDKTITIGICGLQPHIGVTHHALAMAQALSQTYKHICYQEKNNHDAYRVLQKSSIASDKQGYIRIMNVDIFDKNADISSYNNKYSFCIMDLGYIQDCRQEELFDTDIPIVIGGVKDWEIQNFVGAYASGILEQVNVLINFFPEKERNNFKDAFPDLQIFFTNYAPEVFEPGSNIEIYNEIVKKYMMKEV